MPAKKVYLDTSAIVKRYIEEAGSGTVDTLYHEAERGETILCFSEWNLGESAAVFDKYRRTNNLQLKQVLEELMNETREMYVTDEVEIIPVSSKLIAKSIALVMKHHVYVSEALQMASCREAMSEVLMAADKYLFSVSESKDIQTQLIR